MNSINSLNSVEIVGRINILLAELSRARKILLKRMKMKKSYEDLKYVSVSNTRQIG